jgi:2-haloacid dehalogenase
MPYPYVFLDADATLLDFLGAQREAFYAALRGLGFEPDEALLGEYDRINRTLWERLEQGLATREQILIERFERLFLSHNIALDPHEVNRRYLSRLSRGCGLVQGADEMLRRLFGRCRLAVVTNGLAQTQRRRLADAGILHYFTQVVISQEVGFAKPDPRFFHRALALCGVDDRRSVLVVGDSLSADIAGGAAAGLATCWYNPGHLPPGGGVSPTYTIDDLAQLPGIVLPKEGEGHDHVRAGG